MPTFSRRNASRDTEEIQRENQALTQTVKTQEEGFRLQNETLMQELNKVIWRSFRFFIMTKMIVELVMMIESDRDNDNRAYRQKIMWEQQE